MGYKVYLRGSGWVTKSHHLWRFTQDPAKAYVWKTFSGAKKEAKKISNFAEVIECD